MFNTFKTTFSRGGTSAKGGDANDSNDSFKCDTDEYIDTSFRLEEDPSELVHPKMDTSSADGTVEEGEDEEGDKYEVDSSAQDKYPLGVADSAPITIPSATSISNSYTSGQQKKRNSIFDSFKTTMNNVGISVSADLSPDTSYMKIKDANLSAIGKQIRQLELDCLKNDDKLLKEWVKNDKAPLEKDIKVLEQECAALKARLESEVEKGLVHIRILSDELEKHLATLEGLKKRYNLVILSTMHCFNCSIYSLFIAVLYCICLLVL